MQIRKVLSVFAMGALVMVMLAACSGFGGTAEGNATPTSAPTSAPTNTPASGLPTGVPTSIPTLVQGSGCTTADSCQKAVVVAIPNKVKAGEKVTIAGTGWIANAKLQASIGVQALDSNVVTATSDEHGNFSVTLTILAGTPDVGPTNIHISQVGSSNDGKSLNVQNKLTIIK